MESKCKLEKVEKTDGLKELIFKAILLMTKEQNGSPIGFHYKKIYQFILAKGWYTGYKTPERSVNTALTINRDLFTAVLGTRGNYTLKQLCTNNLSLEVKFYILKIN